MMTHDAEHISRLVAKAVVDEAKNPVHRGRAWQRCYNYFAYNTDFSADMDCFNLVAYLACFGMYARGSWLLQQSMEVHRYALSILRDSKYEILRHVKSPPEDKAGLFAELYEKLEFAYSSARQSHDGRNVVSEILITKVIHGVFACVPAFDTVAVSAMNRQGLVTSLHSARRHETFQSVWEFYLEREDVFDQVIEQYRNMGIYDIPTYPPMRLVDMYFWRLGLELQRSPV